MNKRAIVSLLAALLLLLALLLSGCAKERSSFEVNADGYFLLVSINADPGTPEGVLEAFPVQEGSLGEPLVLEYFPEAERYCAELSKGVYLLRYTLEEGYECTPLLVEMDQEPYVVAMMYVVPTNP